MRKNVLISIYVIELHLIFIVKLRKWTDSVSYTHLDVYKRQVYKPSKQSNCLANCLYSQMIIFLMTSWMNYNIDNNVHYLCQKQLQQLCHHIIAYLT